MASSFKEQVSKMKSSQIIKSMQSAEKTRDNFGKKKYQFKTHLDMPFSMKASTNPSFTQSVKHFDQIGFSSSVIGKETTE